MVERGRDVSRHRRRSSSRLEHATLSDDQVRAVRMGQRVTLDAEYHDDEIAAMDGGGRPRGHTATPR